MTTLRRIYQEKQRADGGQVLIVIISDGEPSDGSHRDFFNSLMAKPKNFHVSMAECTDDPRDMVNTFTRNIYGICLHMVSCLICVQEYLDKFDGRIPNFDNTDDYREELQRVRTVNGPLFKFDYFDYGEQLLFVSLYLV
jgi:hypothetical protein